jgi:hypothetical protein
MSKIPASSQPVTPGRIHLETLLPVVLILLFSSNLLQAQCGETFAATNAATVSMSPVGISNTMPSFTTTALTATVTHNNAPVTTGSVTFCNQGVALGSANVNSSGVAALNIALPPASFLIVAHYNGSSQAAPGLSRVLTLIVTGSDSMTLASTGGSSGYTLTATLTSNLSTGPNGTVTFTDQTTGQTLGTANFANQVNTTPVAITGPIGDFTGSGTRDTVLATTVNGSSAFVVTLTNLNGTTSQVVSQPFGSTNDPYQILALGDFNNDGMTDMVVQDQTSDLVTILLSEGDGQFSIAGQLTLPGSTAAVAGDFNNDNNLDFIGASSSGMQFYAGDGKGGFAPGQTISTTAPAPALVGDYLINGNLDFFSYIPGSLNGFANTTLYLGAGDGVTFNEQPQSTTFPGGAPPSNVLSMVELSQGGATNVCPSFAYATNSTVTMMSGCSGSFSVIQTPPNAGQIRTAQFDIGTHANVQLATADVNGSGEPDVIAFVQDETGPNAPWSMIVFLSASPFTMSAEAPSDSSGVYFPNPPVPFQFPLMGEPLTTNSPIAATMSVLSTGAISTGTATLSNVTLTPGNHNIVAYYAGVGSSQAGTPGATSNTVTLAGNSNGYEGPSIGTLATGTPGSSAKVSNGVLTLTDGNTWEQGSAWSPSPVNVQSFATTFTFQLTNAQADGFTFTVQNDTSFHNPVGSAGGYLGYSGPGTDPSKLFSPITPSVALKFDLFDNQGEGSDSTGLYTNGAYPSVPAVDMSGSGIDLHSGDVMQAQVIYDGANLNLTLTDTSTRAVFTHSFPVNIPQLVGSTNAYVGFTGATGGLAATQQILSWTYEPLPYYPNFSKGPGLQLVGGAAMNTSANTLHLLDSNTPNEASSAWFKNPVPITKFTNDFTFVGSAAQADGLTFTIQNAALDAIGPLGGGLGYGPDVPGAPVGITNSMAIKFDLFDNQGEGGNSTGIFTVGDSPTVPAIDLSGTGIDLHNGNPINVHMVYDGSTITMTLTDTVTQATWSHYFYGVDLPTLVGSNTAYVGFTGGTGGLTANEDIKGWTYLPSNTISSPVKTY